MSAGFVLDCSIAVSWCFEDETTTATDALLERLRDEGGLVPALWRWEVANALTTAVRRGRITLATANARLMQFRALPIVTDNDALDRAWRETFALASTHALTSYDAAYLELATRVRLPLATKDDALRQAASKAGVVVLP